MRRLRLIPTVALLVLLGCTTADILRLDPTPRPETTPASIQFLGQEPIRPYKVIAIVSARSGVSSSGPVSPDVRARLVKEAAKLGGHAILFDTSSLTRVGHAESQEQQLTGKVIVYTDSTGSN